MPLHACYRLRGGLVLLAALTNGCDYTWELREAGQGGAGGLGGAGGSGGTSCLPAETRCAGTCVDTMTNEGHCGTCDRACKSGDCENGRCPIVPLSDSLVSPTDVLLVDGSTNREPVYVATGNGVTRYALDADNDGTVDTVWLGGANLLASAGQELFITMRETNEFVACALPACANPTTLTGTTIAVAITGGRDRAYVAMSANQTASANLGHLYQTTLYSLPVPQAHTLGSILEIEESVYWTQRGDDSCQFECDPETGAVYRCTVAAFEGGTCDDVAVAGQTEPIALGAHASRLFWINAREGTGAIQVMSLPDGAANEFHSADEGRDLAIDSTVDPPQVYWVTRTGVHRCAVGDACTERLTLDDDRNDLRAIAVGPEYVYYVEAVVPGTDPPYGRVYRTEK